MGLFNNDLVYSPLAVSQSRNAYPRRVSTRKNRLSTIMGVEISATVPGILKVRSFFTTIDRLFYIYVLHNESKSIMLYNISFSCHSLNNLGKI